MTQPKTLLCISFLFFSGFIKLRGVCVSANVVSCVSVCLCVRACVCVCACERVCV